MSEQAPERSFLRRHAEWLAALGVTGLLLTLVAPLAPWLLDLLLVLNIGLSLLLLLGTMHAGRADELSAFPTLLLFATLFRLGLNVASTRLILSGGDAGMVIRAFGDYMAGQSLPVGLVVFLVLVVIQFVVITKGSSRISEVAARFVLDAMPGKQMAIDADLNSGLIDADDARERRAKIAKEAEFYGAMDGASKFVRGDAIAGLLITALNLLGGISIGALRGMGIGEAVQRYSMLTMGDGLVTQVPALMVSTASAILVTKESNSRGAGYSVLSQMTGYPKATLLAAGVLFALGALPGMPRLPFFFLATALALLWGSTRSRADQAAPAVAARAAKKEQPEAAASSASERVEELLRVDRIALEIGYRLIPLVQDGGGAGILEHIAQLRRRFATRDGLVLPPIRIKDNIRLAPGGYRVLISGQEVARGEIEPGLLMAMDGGGAAGALNGKPGRDPTFGLPATWIAEQARAEAESKGYTVVDSVSVVATHLSEVLRGSLAEVLSRDDVKELIAGVKKVTPAVVEDLVPERLSVAEIQAVLRNLLRENVPIRNLSLILEALGENVGRTKDLEALTELTRQRLGRSLCELHSDKCGTLYTLTLDPAIENRLASAVGASNPEAQPVTPAWLQNLVERIADSLASASRGGKEVVLLARSNVRRFVSELVRSSLPKVHVLSYNEVLPARSVETVGIVKLENH
jgi:flagellar biosynthesis protein FlhA